MKTKHTIDVEDVVCPNTVQRRLAYTGLHPSGGACLLNSGLLTLLTLLTQPSPRLLGNHKESPGLPFVSHHGS